MAKYTELDYERWRRRWLEVRDCKAVAEEFGVAPRTVQYRRKVDNWEVNLDIAESALEKMEAAQVAQADAMDRKVELLGQTQDALGHALGEAQRTRARTVDKASRAALDLGKLMLILEGKAGESGEGQPFTFQQLIFVATGSEGERIAGRVEGSERSRIVPA